MCYNAQKFKFWEQYRHPSVAIVQYSPVQLSTLGNIFVKMLALMSLPDKGNAF